MIKTTTYKSENDTGFAPFITDAGDLPDQSQELLGGRYGVWAYDENLLRYQVIDVGPDLVPLMESHLIPIERVYGINPRKEKA